ncbi:serine hydrolase [Streptomyces sp. NPDC059786]|uniref:D-alanyl-D-alanine carboxypeptidase family protein n=1 Tax=Streptomyces sp. NPDC059786 TaxID=3346946 RepID=UPI00365F99F2
MAAWVATADDDPAEGDSADTDGASASADGAAAAAEGATGGEAGDAAEGGTEGTAGDTGDKPEGKTGDSGDRTGGKAEAAAGAGAGAGTEAGTEGESSGGAEAATGTAGAVEAKGSGDAKGSGGSEGDKASEDGKAQDGDASKDRAASKDGNASEGGEGAAEADRDAASVDRAATEGSKTDKGGRGGRGDKSESGGRDGEDGSRSAKAAGEDDDARPERAVDTPTAVFTKRPRPAVDQPTTMLKLGGAKPGQDAKATPKTDSGADSATDSGSKSDPAPSAPKTTPAAQPGKGAGEDVAAESPSERTSKFVALKPLDEPASRPKPQVPGPAAPGRSTVPPADATAAVPQIGPERTTQQPLPPKPPLDLLAELTNTPPPPETPVRTLVRRIKIWTPLVLLLVVIFAVVQAVRPLPDASLGLTAAETYTFEGDALDLPWPGQGQSAIEVEGVGSLGTDGKQTPKPIASVAKIMTAYVVLQEHPLKGNEGGEKITVDQQAEDESKNEDESTAALTKGQKFTERQMLQMLMIPSGNNAARLLARWDSDSETFVGKMNAAAKKLGMTQSTYTDPSGLEKTTVSTATDQIKLAKAVMQNEVFRSIVGMASAKIPGLDKPIYNNNDLLVQQVGVIGLKTGSSTPAGGNLVWAATKTVDGKTQTIYGAVMNQDAGTGKVWDSLHLSLTNSQKLIDKVQQSLTSATVVKKGDVVGYVDDQLGGRTPVVATKNMKAVGWPGLKTKLSIGTGDKTVPHSAEAGTVVGELTVGDGSDHAVKIPVALQSDLSEPGFGAKLTRVS